MIALLLLIVLSGTSPLPANVAGSEGAHPPTTPMPATYNQGVEWFPGRAQPDRPMRDRDASARYRANGRAASHLTSSPATGEASWYCRPGVSRCTAGYPASGPYAAAGPELRAVPGWRGRWVLVCAGHCIEARLIDYCACPNRVIDLYASRFRELAPLSRGTVQVSVAFLAREDVRLPATDTEEATHD